MTAANRQTRQQVSKAAQDLRLRCLREGRSTEETVDEIMRELPSLFPLEAWRFAQGWSRTELSARIDALYRTDGLAAPQISSAELCRWEHGSRRPNDERIEYLCRVYGTRPDRLGYGYDYSAASVNHLEKAGLLDLYPRTNTDSERDLVERLRAAKQHINVFGLTRNFYARDDILPLFRAKATQIPVTFYVMEPFCSSRKDRYRIEPAEAAMEDPNRYVREVLRPLYDAQRQIPVDATGAGLRVFTFNFPCAFGIEEIDSTCRVMLYGHGKRGTQGPILTFANDTDAHNYFTSQIRWLEGLASGEIGEPWTSKDIAVRPLTEDTLNLATSRAAA